MTDSSSVSQRHSLSPSQAFWQPCSCSIIIPMTMREGEEQTFAGRAGQQQPKPDVRRRDLYGGPYKGSSMVFTKDATCMVVKVRDVKDLFVAPEADPFSAYDYEVTGEAVLIRVCRILATKHFLDATPHPFRSLTILWCYLRQPKLALDRLIVQVPLNVYQDDCTETVNAALKRYCELRIYDNHLKIKVMRRKNDSLLVFGFLMLFLFIGLAMLFSSEHVTESNFTATLAEGFNILGWVLLWHPWETWVFDPIEVRTDIKVHEFLLNLELEICPQVESQDTATGKES